MITLARRTACRAVALLTVALGVDYVAWRWLASVNWAVGWIAVPLALAETGVLVGAAVLGVAVWRGGQRAEPPPPDSAATVDVFVVAHGEPGEPVRRVVTAADAARRIAFPHRTWILDDSLRPDLCRALDRAGIGYLARSASGVDHVEQALFATDGEFLLLLDVDQVPDSTLLDRVLGHFRDPDVALVRLPRTGLGGAADRDGEATLVLRRDALLHVGFAASYDVRVRWVERTVRRVLRTAETLLRNARTAAKQHGPGVLAALDQVEAAVADARGEVCAAGRRTSLAEITGRFRQRVDTASRGLVDAGIVTPYPEVGEAPVYRRAPVMPLLDSASLTWLTRQDMSPQHAMASVRALVDAVDVSRVGDARPISPGPTLPASGDPAVDGAVTTTMILRLRAAGWTSVTHEEHLVAEGGPGSLAVGLDRRLRWAQGTLQALLTERPLTQRGLAVGLRLRSVAAMGTFLAAFLALAHLAAPVLLLCGDVAALHDYGPGFLFRLGPYLLLLLVLRRVAGGGGPYRLALFPLGIRAVCTAVGNVVRHRSPGDPWALREDPRLSQLIWPQVTAMAVLAAAAVVGTARYLAGVAGFGLGALVVNLGWVFLDLVVLASVLPRPGRVPCPGARAAAV